MEEIVEQLNQLVQQQIVASKNMALVIESMNLMKSRIENMEGANQTKTIMIQRLMDKTDTLHERVQYLESIVIKQPV